MNYKEVKTVMIDPIFKLFMTMFFALGLTLSYAQQQAVPVDDGYQIDIKTSAICEMCQYTLERDLAFEKGVKEASLDLSNKVMTIVYNPKKTDDQILRERITQVGYHADTLSRDPIAYDKLPMCCKDGAHGTPIPQMPLMPRDLKK